MKADLPPVVLSCLMAPLVTGTASVAGPATPQDDDRRTQPSDFELPLERWVLANGLVVLLVPDLRASGVFVEIGFRAGTIHEPRGRSGLAHFVEHLLATGTSAGTDYARQAERRGA